MRIALSGAHRVGKTTLAEALGDALPGHEVVVEPYHEMAADGHVFAHPPTVEDFEDQLDHSIDSLLERSGEDMVFDRCPVDLLAYLRVERSDPSYAPEPLLEELRGAMASLDLVVFVPIESPDRIDFADDEDLPGTRDAVDGRLRELLMDDPLGLGVDVLEVRGPRSDRVDAVLRRLSRTPDGTP